MFPQNTHLTVCPSDSHVNCGSHSFVSFLRLSISARCCACNMNARNKEHEGDRRCAYAVHINNNTIPKESQSPIHWVLARSCWRAGPGQEASDGSKVRREGKAAPFIPCEIRVQTGRHGQQRLRSRAGVVGRPQASAPRRKRIHLSDDVYSWARTCESRWQHMRPDDNVCA